ncbi:MAG: hypothetical protein ABMB14_02130 [Myxococcota bacterium]
MSDVPLTWAWPDQFALDVHEERSVETSDHRGERVYRSINRYRLERAGSRIRIVDHHRQVVQHEPVEPGTFDHLRVLRFVEECGPSFEVDARGQVGDLAPDLVAAVQAAVRPPPMMAAMFPAAAGVASRLSTPGMVRTAAEALWNTIVGGFAGGSVPVEGSAGSWLDIPVAAICGHPLPHRVELRLLERRADGRVRIGSEVRPEPDAIARAAEAVAAPGLGGVRVEGLDQVTRTELVTDPATLVPKRATVERRSSIRVRGPGATEATAGRSVEVRSWTFTRVEPRSRPERSSSHPGPPQAGAPLPPTPVPQDPAVGHELDPEDQALLALLASDRPDPEVLDAVARRWTPPLPPALVAAVRARIAPCPWGDQVGAWIRAQPDRQAWIALCWHAVGAVGKTRPTRTWHAAGAPLIRAVGVEALRERVRTWCDVVPRAESHGVHAGGALGPTNAELLRGLLLLVAPHADEACVAAMERLAVAAWDKVSMGPRAPHLGVGVLVALASAPEALASPAFRRLDPRIAYERARREIDRALS